MQFWPLPMWPWREVSHDKMYGSMDYTFLNVTGLIEYNPGIHRRFRGRKHTMVYRDLQYLSGFSIDNSMFWCITRSIDIPFRGPGGPRSISTFLLILIEGNGSCQELFSVWKNIVPSQSYRILKSRKYIQ